MTDKVREKETHASGIWCYPSTKKRFDSIRYWVGATSQNDTLVALLDFYERHNLHRSKTFTEVIADINKKEEVASVEPTKPTA